MSRSAHARLNRRTQVAAHGFAAPAIILTIVVLYVPFLWTGYLSFTEFNGFGDPTWVGLANYVEMLTNPDNLQSVINTLMWVVGTLLLPVGLGLLIALLCHDLKGGIWFRLPFLIPFAISGIAVGVVWSFLLESGVPSANCSPSCTCRAPGRAGCSTGPSTPS
ncbi:carbohydrate ABC transporter permease [Tessaracoccus coleopterorum]|uniref:carbohydrate ABC transporter permease n=1 Tax=Tessaracoccus coleopterorum TaxID=2714950 RepID=UPI0018D3C190|nr:sugar ABC transporter permease [Tessaracoccus coleopterorum]